MESHLASDRTTKLCEHLSKNNVIYQVKQGSASEILKSGENYSEMSEKPWPNIWLPLIKKV